MKKIKAQDIAFYEAKYRVEKKPGYFWGDWKWEGIAPIKEIDSLQESKTPLVIIAWKDYDVFSHLILNDADPKYIGHIERDSIIHCFEKPVSIDYFHTNEEDNTGTWSRVWLFRDKVYYNLDDYNEEDARLLILEHIDKERRKWERLKKKYGQSPVEAEEAKHSTSRRISEEVKTYVWRRDGGKCVRCGSKEKLEYDHIIPISKGGSNTARNIELLCEKCNREKSNNIQ